MGWNDNWEPDFDDEYFDREQDAAVERDEGEDLGEHEVVHETEKAIRVRVVGASMFDEAFWIPRSVLRDGNEIEHRGDSGDLVVAIWFAEKEGLA